MWCKQRRKKKDASKDNSSRGASGKTNSEQQPRSPRTNRSEAPLPPTQAQAQAQPQRGHHSANGPMDVSGHAIEKTTFISYHQSFSSADKASSSDPVGVVPIPTAAAAASDHVSQLPLRGVVSRGRTPPPPAAAQNQQIPVQYQTPPSRVLTPNLRPSPLSVPLPSAPLSASILDSLEGGEADPNSTKDDRLNSKTSTGRTTATDSTHPVDPPSGTILSNVTTATGDSMGVAGEGVAGIISLQHTLHLQKVIEAQRSQLALLKEISQIVSSNKSMEAKISAGGAHFQGEGLRPPSAGQGGVTSRPGGVASHPGGAGTLSNRVMDRNVKFDYGNIKAPGSLPEGHVTAQLGEVGGPRPIG